MIHQNILVLGGSGFIGRHVVSHLVNKGRRVTVLTRRRDSARELFPLPTVDVVQADPYDPATLRAMLAGQDALINLVGVLHSDVASPYGRAFRRAHVELPTVASAACNAAGVDRLVHISAIGASVQAPSMYLRSKADGEKAVLGSGVPSVTIVRPSVVFGSDDAFLNSFVRLARWLPAIPLPGAQAHFQPVYVGDVATAIVDALDQPCSAGVTYELGGPRIMALEEIVRLVAAGSGYARPVLRLPHALERLQATLMEWAPGPTILSRDNLDSMRVPNIADANRPGFEALRALSGLPYILTTVEQVIARLFTPHSRRSPFDGWRGRANR